MMKYLCMNCLREGSPSTTCEIMFWFKILDYMRDGRVTDDTKYARWIFKNENPLFAIPLYQYQSPFKNHIFKMRHRTIHGRNIILCRSCICQNGKHNFFDLPEKHYQFVSNRDSSEIRTFVYNWIIGNAKTMGAPNLDGFSDSQTDQMADFINSSIQFKRKGQIKNEPSSHKRRNRGNL